MSDSVRPHRRQPTRLPRPWDSPGKNTGVGCHFLLQCMNVKSESEVAQSCLTLRDPMDCSLPGSSIHGIFQARVLEWGAIAFSINLILTWYSGLYIQIWSHISGKFLFYLKSYFKSMSHWPQEVSLMFPDVTLNDSHFLAVGTAQQSCCATFLPNCIFSHVT